MTADAVSVACRRCGCVDARACPGGCYWVEPDLCSSCRDIYENELLAAGAVFMALRTGDRSTGCGDIEVVVDDSGHVTNEIDVRFSFLKSTYRCTVTMVPDTAREN